MPAPGRAQIAAYFGLCEFNRGFDEYKSGTPGDYGWEVLASEEPEEKRKTSSALRLPMAAWLRRRSHA